MRRENLYPFFICLLIFLTGMKSLWAWQNDSEWMEERVGLFTDRTMYIAGEKIRISALVYIPGKVGTPAGSRVLYCELITPDGNRVAGAKFELVDSRCNGTIQVPEDVASGTYYLKSYTKLMRNQGPSSYKFNRLIIVNSEKTTVLPDRDADSAGSPNNTGLNAGKTEGYAIITDKKSFEKRQKVELVIKELHEKSQGPVLMCVSVIPAESFTTYPPHVFPEEKAAVNIDFVAEHRGISLTGRLMDKNLSQPPAGVSVNLSILGDKDILAARTDSAGRFFFSLPDHFGPRDIFICTGKVPGMDPYILVDNDFCPENLALPAPPFDLTAEQKNAALNLALNTKLANLFSIDTLAEFTDDQPENKASFYGDPTSVLVIDKYIELPTLEEYFNELPTQVKVRKSQGRKYFRFTSTQAEMVIYDPLVLIDYVAVDDIDRVLGLSPRDISRIELVNAPYVKGNFMYGGIISFISKDDDFAGIDLPTSGTFISYQFFAQEKSINLSPPSDPNIPDSRNTIFWAPDLPSLGEEALISFITADMPGSYLVVLQVLDALGNEEVIKVPIEIF